MSIFTLYEVLYDIDYSVYQSYAWFIPYRCQHVDALHVQTLENQNGCMITSAAARSLTTNRRFDFIPVYKELDSVISNLEGLRCCVLGSWDLYVSLHVHLYMVLHHLSPIRVSIMSIPSLPLVNAYAAAIQELLRKTRYSSQHKAIEPALSTRESEETIDMILKVRENYNSINHQAHYAVLETAFRDLFYGLLVSNRGSRLSLPSSLGYEVSTSINDPLFNQVWTLLDFLLILSDNGRFP